MKKLKSWIIDILVCHWLLANPKLDKDDADNTVKIAAMITVCIPLLAALVAYVVIASNPETLESVKAVIVVSVLLIYFGVSNVTDRIYDRNKNQIRQVASEIQTDSDRGVAWARSRIAKFYVLNIAVMAVMVILSRLAI